MQTDFKVTGTVKFEERFLLSASWQKFIKVLEVFILPGLFVKSPAVDGRPRLGSC